MVPNPLISIRLPTHLSPSEFDTQYRRHPPSWVPAIAELCERHGLSPVDIVPFADGSNLIASVADQVVVKVFPPFHRHQWESEWRTLQKLAEHPLIVSVPRLIAYGTRDDSWTFVILSKLSGVTLERVWPQLSRPEKIEMMNQIGHLMAQVHSVPVGTLEDLDPPWALFLHEQAERCKVRHSRLGMPNWFLNEVNDYVAARFAGIPDESPVILTGEYTPFNLLVQQIGTQWRLTGMIDFGDVMIGFREYDFLGPCLFLGEGDPLLVDGLFQGYGYANPRSDAALRGRLMLLAILHRYSNLEAQIRIDVWASRVHSISELERLVFSG